MRFIEIADEEALNLPADQLKAIAVYNQLCLNATLEQDDLKAIATYNYLLSVQPDYVPEDINISPEEIDKQYQKLMQQIKG